MSCPSTRLLAFLKKAPNNRFIINSETPKLGKIPAIKINDK